MEVIVPILFQLLDLAVPAAKAGLEIGGLIQQAKTAHESGADPTDAQWQAVNDGIASLRASLAIDPPDAPAAGTAAADASQQAE